MRVLVCGGRDFKDVAKLWRVLDELDQTEGPIRCVMDGASDDVTGSYIGADYWGNQWALARDKPTLRFHAEWKCLGRAAGPTRNKRMLVEGKPDVVVAAPGGRGTADMIRQTRAAGVRVIEVS